MSDDVLRVIVLQKIHNGILKYFELMVSREKQVQYQKDVPYAQVVAELFLIWDDIQPFDDPKGHYPKPAFSVEEQQAIQQYHAAWKKCSDEFPDTNLPIEEFQGTQTWQKLNEAARIALDVFSTRGLLPED